MSSNILISSAGRRVELLKDFKKELKLFSPDAMVIACDANPELSAACHLADDFFVVPRVIDEGFIDVLIERCIQNSVKLIIPTIDTELKVYSVAKERLAQKGITVVVSETDFIDICTDKRLTSGLFKEYGIATPKSYNPDNLKFPCFVKQFNGSRSVGTQTLFSTEDLTASIVKNKTLMFQEYIDRREFDEFTVDMYYGRDNILKCIVPRLRLEIRDGEVSKAVTRKNVIINYLREKLSIMPGVRGPICVQLFYNRDTGEIIGIEINPRFGGGYPLSFDAGANFPRFIIDEYLRGSTIEYYDGWKENFTMLRYDSHVTLKI